MPFYRTALRRGVFSLLEVAVVLVVLAVVATIVGPRVSRAAATARRPSLAHEHLLTGQLRMMRHAIDEYAADHHGRHPEGAADQVVRQLTEYSDGIGHTSPTRTRRHRLGPYLREIPAIPVGPARGKTTLALPDQPLRDVAWVYDPTTGHVRPAAADLPEHDPLLHHVPERP
jgi:hypothetical protein